MADNKIKVNYNKIDTPQLATLLEALGEKGKSFNASEFVDERPAKTKLVDVVNADGKPKYYIDKKGKTRIRKKKVADGDKKEKYFNLMKAKLEFYKLFKDNFDWENAPSLAAAKKERDAEVAKALAALGVKLD